MNFASYVRNRIIFFIFFILVARSYKVAIYLVPEMRYLGSLDLRHRTSKLSSSSDILEDHTCYKN